jgi:hypothetical protein
MNRPDPSNSVEAGFQGSVHYHLQGLLWQSLAFTGIENTFRRRWFLGMMWATVFSTEQKTGPLSEPAAGSAGGDTYVIGCAFVLHL